MMTENQREWLKGLYREAAKEHRSAAQNEHLWALGSEGEASALHAQNSVEHVRFANILTDMANNLED